MMWAICIQEFKSLFKTWKSMLVIILFLSISFLSGKFFSNHQTLLMNNGDVPVFVSSIRALVLFLGTLFVMALSHDCVNKEIEHQTMRLLVTKCSRDAIIFGKFLGIFLFWGVCLLISFSIVSLYSNEFYIMELIKLLSFLSFVIAIAILLSSFVHRPNHTMFLGILVGLLIPIIGIWSLFDARISMLKYMFPYYYMMENGLYIFVPLLFSFLIVLLVILYMRGRDF
ncbi:ABC transporter permease [Anoxybacillus sp.]|uniref:ABC transporter permease n=1 Tax=Anoxybacillus sp. TaxID=1872573 RepID=UPI002616870E|nr:ABC transporter permease subunit [uncultured Anoxybacillus sp.]